MFFYCITIFFLNPYFHFTERQPSIEHLLGSTTLDTKQFISYKLECNNYSFIKYSRHNRNKKGTAVAQWLRCCATNRKVAGSIPAGNIGIFH